jgi:uncharacterized sodium:solute symporter family permease YidK
MHFWTAFWITIVMGIASLIAVKLGHKDIKALISIMGTLAVAVPILVIYISGMMGMYQTSETEEVGKIASATIDKLFTWLGNNIESIIAGDFAGAVLGVIFGWRTVS